MRIIIDNNILFSLMKPDSINSHLFSIIRAEFFAPDFIKQEFTKYEEECFLKSRLSKEDFTKRKKEVFSRIKFVDFLEYKFFIKEAKNSILDTDDFPYIALGLKLNCPIWSNDKDLKKQDKVKVFSTKDIVEVLT